MIAAMDIPLHVLRYFCVLADELHFGKAAAALRISPPSLSQQISRLERNIGARLFERTPAVALTAAGAELLPLARRVGDDHREILRWVAALRGVADGELLRIGMVAAGAGSLTTEILAGAVQRLPSARIELRRLGFFDTREELLAGRVDVVFAPGPMAVDDRIEAHPLWTEPRVLVVPVSHPLAARDSVSIDELRDEVFVTAGGNEPDIQNWWLVDPRPDGSHPTRGSVADDFEGLLELVAAGGGVNIASEAATMHYRRDGIAYPRIRDIEPATIYLCSLKRPGNPSVDGFVTIAKELAMRRSSGGR